MSTWRRLEPEPPWNRWACAGLILAGLFLALVVLAFLGWAAYLLVRHFTGGH